MPRDVYLKILLPLVDKLEWYVATNESKTATVTVRSKFPYKLFSYRYRTIQSTVETKTFLPPFHLFILRPNSHFYCMHSIVPQIS